MERRRLLIPALTGFITSAALGACGDSDPVGARDASLPQVDAAEDAAADGEEASTSPEADSGALIDASADAAPVGDASALSYLRVVNLTDGSLNVEVDGKPHTLAAFAVAARVEASGLLASVRVLREGDTVAEADVRLSALEASTVLVYPSEQSGDELALHDFSIPATGEVASSLQLLNLSGVEDVAVNLLEANEPDDAAPEFPELPFGALRSDTPLALAHPGQQGVTVSVGGAVFPPVTLDVGTGGNTVAVLLPPQAAGAAPELRVLAPDATKLVPGVAAAELFLVNVAMSAQGGMPADLYVGESPSAERYQDFPGVELASNFAYGADTRLWLPPGDLFLDALEPRDGTIKPRGYERLRVYGTELRLEGGRRYLGLVWRGLVPVRASYLPLDPSVFNTFTNPPIVPNIHAPADGKAQIVVVQGAALPPLRSSETPAPAVRIDLRPEGVTRGSYGSGMIVTAADEAKGIPYLTDRAFYTEAMPENSVDAGKYLLEARLSPKVEAGPTCKRADFLAEVPRCVAQRFVSFPVELTAGHRLYLVAAGVETRYELFVIDVTSAPWTVTRIPNALTP